METGKPDGIGKVDEETLGPLTLPRPEGHWYGHFLIDAMVAGMAFSSNWLENALARNCGWSKQNADLLAFLATILYFVGAVQFLRYHRGSLKLRLTRGILNTLASGEHFEVWNSGGSIIFTGLGLLAGVGVALWLLASNGQTSKIAGVICLFLCVLLVLRPRSSLLNPLLMADSEAVSIKGRRIIWQNIRDLEVEHVLNIYGDFYSVKLTFLGHNGGKLGRVSLPKQKCPVAVEAELLDFFARTMGHRFSPVAPDGRSSL